MNETQRTLYALNALCGEICNGGIAQFFFNADPVLWGPAATALERIGASDALREYLKILARMTQNEGLAGIRAAAQKWDDYLRFKEGLGGEQSAHAAFDDWFFAGQGEVLDRLMRAYIVGREDDLVRFCDGVPRLEALWSGERLGRLVDDFDRYQSAYADRRPYGFFDHLFTPDHREQFGRSRAEREEAARVVVTGLMPLIRKAAREPGLASYAAQSSPRITIIRPSRSGHHRRVAISFHENEGDLMWSISEWE